MLALEVFVITVGTLGLSGYLFYLAVAACARNPKLPVYHWWRRDRERRERALAWRDQQEEEAKRLVQEEARARLEIEGTPKERQARELAQGSLKEPLQQRSRKE